MIHVTKVHDFYGETIQVVLAFVLFMKMCFSSLHIQFTQSALYAHCSVEVVGVRDRNPGGSGTHKIVSSGRLVELVPDEDSPLEVRINLLTPQTGLCISIKISLLTPQTGLYTGCCRPGLATLNQHIIIPQTTS